MIRSAHAPAKLGPKGASMESAVNATAVPITVRAGGSVPLPPSDFGSMYRANVLPVVTTAEVKMSELADASVT